jgi:hypothetical protein
MGVVATDEETRRAARAEAHAAGTEALAHLEAARRALARADSLGTWEFFAGVLALVLSPVKHVFFWVGRRRAAKARRALVRARRALAHLPVETVPVLPRGGAATLADVLFDPLNLAGFVVQNRIEEAQWRVDRARRSVRKLLRELDRPQAAPPLDPP